MKAGRQREAYSGCGWGNAAVSLATFIALVGFIIVLLIKLHAHRPLKSAMLDAGIDALVAFCASIVLSVGTISGIILKENWRRRSRKK